MVRGTLSPTPARAGPRRAGSTALTLRAPLTLSTVCLRSRTHNATACLTYGQHIDNTLHAHARHTAARRCTSRCQCALSLSAAPHSLECRGPTGVRARPHTPLPPGARGQRPWPCTIRHKAKATTHMAQASCALWNSLPLYTRSCTPRLGGVAHALVSGALWCGGEHHRIRYSRFDLECAPPSQAVTSDLANP